MGFSGSFIVARADRPVTELAALRSSPCVAVWWARNDSWQILQALPGGDPDVSIVAETAAPVLVCHVVDSDFVTVQAASPGGLSWQSVLSPAMARDYGFPEKWIGDPDEVAEQAVAWAREAGLHPTPAEVRAALVQERDLFAENLVFQLSHALGFRFDGGVDLPKAP
ncbi:hypothetical protein [Streptomyces sp. SID3343]|uniref:hypothetical protein n=1 Tax=Streptomyces sp. SID3343 TaxID=2690260 RepID=UPI001368BB31|nr:hypothetical protein [Streptomyces sp. SID3343]MYV97570.1 hypothetical protein [Streptomyces sp. SID3343]